MPKKKKTTEPEKAANPNKVAILAKLRELGVAKVGIDWSGGGDSGQIDSVMATDKKGKAIKIDDAATTVEITTDSYALGLRKNDGTPLNEKTRVAELVVLDTAIERLVEEWWEATGQGGWWNNDGGQGSGVIDVEEGTITLEHYNNETVSNLGASEVL